MSPWWNWTWLAGFLAGAVCSIGLRECLDEWRSRQPQRRIDLTIGTAEPSMPVMVGVEWPDTSWRAVFCRDPRCTALRYDYSDGRSDTITRECDPQHDHDWSGQ